MIDSKSVQSKILLALQCVEELTNKKKYSLIDVLDCIEDVLSSNSVVTKVLGYENALKFFDNYKCIDDYIARLEKCEVHWLTYLEDEYPASLLEIGDYPIVLFYKGSIDAVNSNGIAVVGTRRPTRYGAKIAQEFSSEFARAGLTVISGLARGVDSIAHKACVEQGGTTVAVYASGLDICYPAEHRGLQDSILASGGAIVSEYALGVKPLQYHFPERNRIVSGLSRAVFLPQAAKKSGSLITMRLAIEQGKDIFVVPGNIYDEESEGSNALLREMPHALAISPEDVLDSLHISREVIVKEAVEISLVESMILDALHDDEKHFEELLQASGLAVAELTNVLFDMELNGLIEKTAGNYYMLA